MKSLSFSPRTRYILGALFMFALFMYLIYPYLLNSLSSSLLRNDSPQEADAVVVLGSNRKGECVESAIGLHESGYKNKFYFSGGSQLYRNVKIASAYLRQFEEGGVPLEMLVWSEEAPANGNTSEEIIFRLLKRDSIGSVIVLAQPLYTAYEGKVFEEIAEREKYKIDIRVTPCIDSETVVKGWWLHRQSAKTVYFVLSKRLLRWLG